MKKLISLSTDLEASLLAAVIKGLVPPAAAEEAELSKTGRIVLKTVRGMVDEGQTAPLSLGSISLRAVELQAANRDEVRKYLAGISRVSAETDIADIIQKVRDKQILVDLVNAAVEQLQQGVVDVTHLTTILQRETIHDGVESVSELIKDGLPEPPQGLPLFSLPFMSDKTGGVYGVWAVAGEPKAGKSTLSWQIALDVASHGTSVIYYDVENGWPVMMERTRKIFNGDLQKIRKVTERLYYRENIRSLDRDLAAVSPPALIVVDSVQKMPTSMNFRRDSLDKWVHRFESLKKRGYHTLLVSEVSRAMYGEASMSSFKETGEIEYSADTGLQLLPTTGGMVEVHVVAARHRPFKGFLEHLMRKREWLWKEADSPLESQDLD